MQLRAVTGCRAVGAEGRTCCRRKDEGHGNLADETRGVDREASQRSGARKALVLHSQIGGICRCAQRGRDIAGKVSRRTIRRQALVNIGIERPGRQLGRSEIMFQLGRKIDRPLIVGWADVAVIAQFMVVDIFKEGAAKGFDMEYRVEVDRCTRQFGIAGLQIDIGRLAQIGHETAIDGIDFLIIHNLAVEEGVPVKTVRRAVVAGQYKARIIAQRRRDIGRAFNRLFIGVAELHRTFERIARFDRRDHNGTGSGIASVNSALRTFQNFNLAQRSLRLVQLRGVGF